ncbi:aerobic C4-dicarboxylate transport protein [Actinocorallia herbida]|uniref:Aerobic C4-dicarboxylate transport protein n=1 Tax=Actinocorallia herbida TaxID=58109 RepID=A0A3N1CWQ7_9ACTN|nr:C4-dicarboxylate transporter DctA [Actinocorallia herbida]ROO85723.1 aerobic C4-dicarboxylate transport protein [Actinocorallia herbida]
MGFGGTGVGGCWFRRLYVQVLVAIVAGVVVGWRWPEAGRAMEPVGTTFVAAMKMLIGPLVFLTVVGGIAGVADLRKVGLTGVKALAYFQVGTLIALVAGLVAGNVLRLGEGVHADPAALATSATAQRYVAGGESRKWWEFLTGLVPDSFFGAFVEGNVLQVIFLAVLFGVGLQAVGPVGAPLLDGVRRLTEVVFQVLGLVMKAAPVAAFAAMAYAIGAFGLAALAGLGSLVALFYATSILFVVVVLGGVLAAYVRLNIFRLIRHLKEEYLLVLGTSTSEPALPGLMRKLTDLGADRAVVGLVVPTGYSFNLDGAAIYLSLAALYIAQATDTPLGLGDQIALLAVLLLTSKGAAGVAGAGFLALTATLSALGTVPAAGIMLIFGIDKFMSECRALVNFSGNAVAALVIAKWSGALDSARARAVLAERPPSPSPEASGETIKVGVKPG